VYNYFLQKSGLWVS